MNNISKTTIASTATAVVAAAVGSAIMMSTNAPESIEDSSLNISISEYIPDMSLYEVEIPSVDVPNIGIDSLVDDSSFDNIDTKGIIPEYDFNALNTYIDNYELATSKIKDPRYFTYETSLLDSEYFNDWMNIYDNYKDKSFNTPELIKPFRMITEIRLPKSNEEYDILLQNLDYYSSRGYDSVLVVIYGNEPSYELRKLYTFIKNKNYRIFFTYGGEESLHTTVFIDPRKLKSLLEVSASYGEGFIIGWRRTSAHLIELDTEFMNFMIDSIYSVNPNVNVIGEVYYGNTSRYQLENQWGFASNIPSNSSLVMINNFGFVSVNIPYVMDFISKNFTDKKLVGVSIGHRPYYLSDNKNYLSQSENQSIKESIESRFIQAGCYSTITLHDDGKDSSRVLNNNLSSTLYSNLIN